MMKSIEQMCRELLEQAIDDDLVHPCDWYEYTIPYLSSEDLAGMANLLQKLLRESWDAHLTQLIAPVETPTCEKSDLDLELSVIIPSWKDPYLHKTVADILANFTSRYEVIVVIDGYELTSPLPDDSRVRVIHHKENRGMREAINTGVAAAKGHCLMRTDEHCMFCPGFDSILLSSIDAKQIMTAKRYDLDPIKWERLPFKPIEYERLIIQDMGDGIRKFSSQPWHARCPKRADFMIDKTMGMQGSCWMMQRAWWDRAIGKLETEGYGPHYQDSTEMIFKSWKLGGKLMLNKNAWYAHKYRKFKRTHHYPRTKSSKEWMFAVEKWEKDYVNYCKEWGTGTALRNDVVWLAKPDKIVDKPGCH